MNGRARSTRARRGTTLIEAVMAIVVMGISLPPLVGLFREVSMHSVDDTYQSVALAHAEALMEEIVSKEFEDPDLSAGSFGTEEGTRAQYDDLDDFDGLSNSPPESLDGTDLDDYGGFSRSATVVNVTDGDPDPTSPEADGSTELKHITVTVTWTAGRGGELSLSTLRSKLTAEEEAGDPTGPINVTASAATATNDEEEESFTITFVSAVTYDVEIESFSLAASRSVSDVKKYELATVHDNWTQIWGGQESVPTGVLDTDESEPEERVVPGNGSADAFFEFDDDIDEGDITFTIVLNFTDSSTSTIVATFEWEDD